MTFTEAIQAYRQRNLLPEEQVIAELARNHEPASGANHLDEALVQLLANDVGCPDDDGVPQWMWQHDIAVLEGMLELAREVVELRVLVGDLRAKISEALKIAEVVA